MKVNQATPARYRVFLLSLVLLLVSLAAHAQQNSTITGTVLDKGGAAVPGADVTLTQQQTGFVSKSISNESGNFTFNGLNVGTYDLKATAKGFSAFVQKGIVVNVSSLGGLITRQDLGVYHATKAALINLTQHYALELAPKVRVNAVAPGLVRTQLSEALLSQGETQLAAQFPLQRIGVPTDVAGTILFLASDMASWVTGVTIIVDGGQMLGAPSNATVPDLTL